MISSAELRKKFLEFFKKKNHAIVPSSSLVSDDPSVLLTTAGMQQFKPYFIGEADPVRDFNSKNTASVQKCFRTSDIDLVGDETHLTFFEMLGNFSFGGYFKKEAIRWAHEFIVRELGLTIDYVSVFGGGKKGQTDIPYDEESEKIWRGIGVSDIHAAGVEDNFWGPTGGEGPCGPTTEIYAGGSEIWNIVFNEYYCRKSESEAGAGMLEKLKTPGVDTGMGLERLAMAAQGKKNIFETDLFDFLMDEISDKSAIQTRRVMADHIRAMAFLIADGVRPSNKEAGYALRRVMRRVIALAYKENIGDSPEHLLKLAIDEYKKIPDYDNLDFGAARGVYEEECSKFLKTVERGVKAMEKRERIDAKIAFDLYQTYGLPYETIKDIGGKKAAILERKDFEKEFEKHQEASKKGEAKKFGGHGLVLDTGELKAASREETNKVIRLHTATHLLHEALRKVLGGEVKQAGSDITAKRTRFDFMFSRKLTGEELKKVENIVNEVVKKDLSVIMKEMNYEDALKSGALSFFKNKYPNKVKVYSVVGKNGDVFSSELCAGPHVRSTGEIGEFKIIKEEAVSSGVRRVRAAINP